MNLIYGPEKFYIEQQVNNLKEKNNHLAVEVFDFENKNIFDLFNIIASNNFFFENKLFLIYNCPYFTSKTIKEEEKAILKDFFNIINSNHGDVYVFINDDLEAKSKIVKNEFTNLFLKISDLDIFEAKKPGEKEIYNIALNLVKNYKLDINKDALELLINKLGTDITLINNEIAKLAAYNKKIDADFVDLSVEDANVSNAFSFSNSLESNDLGYIFKMYKEKINEGYEITVLISQVSQLLIIANQIYGYKQTNKTMDQLASDLNINVYRLKKVNTFLSKLGINKINKMIKTLARLDQDIKEGKTNDRIGFERFLIKFFNK
ncbi:UNVERIFIED_CONTAM: DNA polymerase III subunit delta [Campylobacter lari]